MLDASECANAVDKVHEISIIPKQELAPTAFVLVPIRSRSKFNCLVRPCDRMSVPGSIQLTTFRS